jgi:hypothetical protein
MLRPNAARQARRFHLTRVAAYIDGFNLYHGLRSKHGRKYLWLDFELVVTRLLKPYQELTVVRYFTASVRDDAPALARRSSYLGALAAHAPRSTSASAASRRRTSAASAAVLPGGPTRRRRPT